MDELLEKNDEDIFDGQAIKRGSTVMNEWGERIRESRKQEKEEVL